MNVHAISHTDDTAPQDDVAPPRGGLSGIEDALIYAEGTMRALRRVDDHSEDAEDDNARTILIGLLEGYIDSVRAAFDAAWDAKSTRRKAS